MKGRSLLAVCLLAVLAGGVQAGSIVTIGNYWAIETDVTFSMSYQGTGKAQAVDYSYTQSLFPGMPGSVISGSAMAGELIYSIDGENQVVWSLDIAQAPSSGLNTYTAALVLDTMYMISLDKLYYQYGEYVASHQNSEEALTEGAAGFQLAIWELTYENSGFYDLLSGAFTVNNSDAAGLAGSWLTNMDNIDAPGMQRKILVNPSTQDVIHYQTASVVPSVPEPLTMITIAVAGAAIGKYVSSRIKAGRENS